MDNLIQISNYLDSNELMYTSSGYKSLSYNIGNGYSSIFDGPSTADENVSGYSKIKITGVVVSHMYYDAGGYSGDSASSNYTWYDFCIGAYNNEGTSLVGSYRFKPGTFTILDTPIICDYTQLCCVSQSDNPPFDIYAITLKAPDGAIYVAYTIFYTGYDTE